jgi:hypothetical protein
MDEATVGMKISDCVAEGRRKIERHILRWLEDKTKVNERGHRAKHRRQYRGGCKRFSHLNIRV